MQLYNACLQAKREGAATTMATSTVQGTDTTALGPSPQAEDAPTPAGSEVMAAQNTLSLGYAYSPTPSHLCVYACSMVNNTLRCVESRKLRKLLSSGQQQ